MRISTDPIVDNHGRPLYLCSRCVRPLSAGDFYDIGLRLPEPYESRDDYLDSELLDGVEHLDCSRVVKAG